MSALKPLVRVIYRDPLPRLFSRRRAAFILLVPSLSIIFFLFSSETSRDPALTVPLLSVPIKALLDHIPPARTSFRQLVALSGSQRADTLAHALDLWKSGPLPPVVSVAAAVCTLRDAADAIIRGCLDQVTVLDIGAHTGPPVTTIALQRATRLVISVEPNPRSFARLAALPVSRGRLFAPVNAAVSETDGRIFMKFNETGDLVPCYQCPLQSLHRVRTEQISVSTVDTLYLDGHAVKKAVSLSANLEQTLSTQFAVRLFKTDTEGHEKQVLVGAKRLFEKGLVENVLVKFDPHLLASRDNALQTLQQLFEAGFYCTQLTFTSLTDQEKNNAIYPFFGRVAITNATADRFYEFVKHKAKPTDILCSKR